MDDEEDESNSAERPSTMAIESKTQPSLDRALDTSGGNEDLQSCVVR